MDFAERLRMEADCTAFHQEIVNEKHRYRERCINLTNEDKKQRRDWLEKNKKPKCPSEASSNLITKFYKRPAHASHELRAKNDKIRDSIIEKWNLASPKERTIEKPGENYIERKNKEAEAAEQEREAARRRKEIEMARILDK